MAAERAPHAVQFYEHDEQLAEVVGRYLAGGLTGGASAIVIATEPHRAALEGELEGAGLDPDELRGNGRLQMLDAAETLAALTLPDGRIDRHAFHRVIGSALSAAAASGSPVLAFGEMVALLWDAGDVGGALELEKLWNVIHDQVEFSLLCAYRAVSASDPHCGDALEAVCELHSMVLDAPAPALDVFSARLDPVLTAPAHARRLLTDALHGRDPHPDLLLDAQLVISELATNAVRHARTEFWVTVRCEATGVTISVRDGSVAQPIVHEPGPEALSGRGLRLVGDIAEAWGIEWTATDKTVWARLPL